MNIVRRLWVAYVLGSTDSVLRSFQRKVKRLERVARYREAYSHMAAARAQRATLAAAIHRGEADRAMQVRDKLHDLIK